MNSSYKYLYPFEKLRVWQEARIFVKEIYILTNTYPDIESLGLVSQMRRAVISVSSNLEEGTTRTSKKEQARFSNIAYGSLMEIINQLTISVDLTYIKEEIFIQMKPKLTLLSNQINKLRKSQLKEK
jgi:four helix bundle protein